VNCGFKDYPVEVYESKYPFILKRYGFRPDTGGPGRFRGGTGIYREYRLDTLATIYASFERSITPAWGLFGGHDAVGPDVVVNPGREDEQHTLKVNALWLDAGDAVRLSTGGGGDFGNLWERDPERVREDVLDGYLTREGVERDYGVVSKEDLSIDEEATQKRRKAMKAKG
jgi:N-methylhydantoinase B